MGRAQACKMKTGIALALIIAAVTASSIEHETANLEEATDLLQEKVLATAKVGASAKVAAKVAAKMGAQVKARATVMIANKEVDAAAVSMAKAQMHKVIHKLGQKHPHFIGEAAGVENLLDELNSKVNPDCVNGIHKTSKKSCLKHGFTKLKKVLDKVDALELELKAEMNDAIKGRRKKEAECKSTISANDRAIAKMQNENAVHRQDRKQRFEKIDADLVMIADSKTKEGGSQKTSLQSMMKGEVDDLKKTYDDYWLNSDDRALVRNILMQAMWLVCTGFRSFRMHPFCVTLRQQPDFAEPGKAAAVVDLASPSETYRKNSAATQRFSNTMKSVWKDQKAADANAVNRGDGDIDMEKGFVNNRAPWGVAPDGTPAKPKEEQELTKDQMRSRLSFLIETSNAPSRVATPIVDFINALQTNDGELTQKSKSLVDTIVAMDREEGEAQAKEDEEWYQMTIAGQGETNDYAKAMEARRVEQEQGAARIQGHQGKIERINGQIETNEVEIKNIGAASRLKTKECDIDYIEFDTIIEMAKEELVNVQRLNSLLRFLALGEEPNKCAKAGDVMCSSAEQGTCTWVTRGKDHKGGVNKDEMFCACEYGFYGETCELRTCPGFGAVRYPASQPGCCMDKGTCDSSKGVCINCHVHSYHGPENKCEYVRCPKAMSKDEKVIRMTADDDATLECSGKGSCNKHTGVCTCNKDNDNWYGPHCGYKKCPTSDDQGKFVGLVDGTSINSCNGRGVCETKGDKNGKCTCSNRFKGDACEHFKGDCAGAGTFQPLTGRCLCSSGRVGGACVKNAAGSPECHSCQYKSCPKNCFGGGQGVQPNGYCDRISGKCVCNSDETYNGKKCKSICRQQKQMVDWSRSFDKWGWSVCPTKWLLTGLRTDGGGDALYNIDLGQCEKPCEGTGTDKSAIGITHCYHENWWKKFDTKGGKFCRRNYFVAGLFRSHCNSLYCLEMAKCCQVKRSIWTRCQWTPINQAAFQSGRHTAEVQGTKAFIAGFYRTKQHSLGGLTYFYQCEPHFYGAEQR